VVSDEAGRRAISDEAGRRAQPEAEAVEVLRAVWTASGQTGAELDELFGPAKSCKSMQSVGFDGLADSGGGDLRAAWRATLEREGKLSDGPGSVADLVLGSAERAGR
jgi:hypothetical protein